MQAFAEFVSLSGSLVFDAYSGAVSEIDIACNLRRLVRSFRWALSIAD